MSVAADPLIPLITTVPVSGRRTDALAFIKRQQERLPSGVGYSFAIAEAAGDQAVGQIGLWLRDYRHGRAGIGYWLAPQHRGRGYASTALRALTRWAWTLPGLARLELYVEPWNESSWRTAERVGFQREGLLRSWQPVVHVQPSGSRRYGLTPTAAISPLIKHDRTWATGGSTGLPPRIRPCPSTTARPSAGGPVQQIA